MEVVDAGEYSCEMAEKGDTEKDRESVTVSVFERESEELISMKEKESEEIDFIGPIDVTNSRYVSSDEKKVPRFITPRSVSSSCVNSHGICHRKYVMTLVTCVLRGLL